LQLSERLKSGLQVRVDRLQHDHLEALRTMHAYAKEILELEKAKSRHEAELAALRPIERSWWGTCWKIQHWISNSANWVALGKRVLKSMAGVRVLRRLMGLLLRATPGLRARLLAMIGIA
jgi:hypothetical protein